MESLGSNESEATNLGKEEPFLDQLIPIFFPGGICLV